MYVNTINGNATRKPGIAYSVTYKGTLLQAGGLGVKTKGSAGAPDSNTIFRIGSVSKVFAVSFTINVTIVNYS